MHQNFLSIYNELQKYFKIVPREEKKQSAFLWNTIAKRMKCYKIFDGFRILFDLISAGESVRGSKCNS